MNLHSIKPKNLRLKPLKQDKGRVQVTVSELTCKYCGKDCIKNGKEKTDNSGLNVNIVRKATRETTFTMPMIKI
jgi:hypothetical protein